MVVTATNITIGLWTTSLISILCILSAFLLPRKSIGEEPKWHLLIIGFGIAFLPAIPGVIIMAPTIALKLLFLFSPLIPLAISFGIFVGLDCYYHYLRTLFYNVFVAAHKPRAEFTSVISIWWVKLMAFLNPSFWSIRSYENMWEEV